MDGCSWLFILVLGCFFLFLVGFGRFGCFGRHLLLGKVGGCSLFSIVALGCFFLFLVGFGRFGRHLLLGRVGGVVTEVKGKQHATSLATQPTSMWDHAFPRSMMILLMNLMI